MGVIRKLHNDDAVVFDLKSNNKTRFEKSKEQEYSTYSKEFIRTVCFESDAKTRKATWKKALKGYKESTGAKS